MEKNGLNTRKLAEAFRKSLALSFIDIGDADRIAKTIASFKDPPLRAKLLLLCHLLSGLEPAFISPALKRIKRASNFLDSEDLIKWIEKSFETLDTGGIKAFISFIKQASEHELRKFVSPDKLMFIDIAPVLEIFLRGISGRPIAIAPEEDSFTDNETIYLPRGMSRYRSRAGNFFIYKLMTAWNWSQIETGLLTPNMEKARKYLNLEAAISEFPDLFGLFPEKRLAVDLFTLIAAFRLESFLLKEFSGLINRAKPVKNHVFRKRPPLKKLTPRTAFLEGIYQYFLSSRIKGNPEWFSEKFVKRLDALREASPEELVEALLLFYGMAEEREGEYGPALPVFFLGRIDPDRISKRLSSKGEGDKKKIPYLREKRKKSPEDRSLTSFLIRPESVLEDPEGSGRNDAGPKDAIILKLEKNKKTDPIEEHDTHLKEELPVKEGEVSYDEWDYRLGQYRKKWCTLFEQDVPPLKGSLMESAPEPGYIREIKKHFEMLRSYPVLARRRKEGDNLDLEALVELYADLKAGAPPEDENIFSRLEHTERNIAALFLVDMSNSTRGWINRTEKEALIIMSEALEALGDRYSIFGFDSISRLRCNFYRLKGFDEAYSETVRKRIAAMAPGSYTRMGPALRHSASILDGIQAQKKLLIVLSDGRPEDLGAYQGDYAIEDTRKALIEAKQKNIYPFCITIDREAKSYIPHMYGEVNFIEIDDLRKLPDRMARIYRRLTS
jgi:nitric oxide reductase NorD protein